MGFFDQILPNLQRFDDEVPVPNFRYRNSVMPRDIGGGTQFGIPGQQFEAPQIQTPSLDRFREYLGTMPEREQYAPSKWRRLASAIGGASAGWRQGPMAGLETAQGINEMPYRNAVTDWSMKGKGLEEAANIEQRSLGAENQAWRNFAANQLGRDKLDVTEKRNETLGRQGDERLRIQEESAKNNRAMIDARIKALGNPDYSVVSNRDGSQDYLLDKKSGRMVPLEADIYGKPEEVQAATDRALKVMEGYTSTQRGVAELNAGERAADRASREKLAETGGQINPSVALENKVESDALKTVAAKNPGWVGKWISQRPTTGTLSIIFPTVETDPAEKADFDKFYSEFLRTKQSRAPKAPTAKTSIPATPGPEAMSGPAVGTKRTNPTTGETRTWNGKQWVK